MLRILLSYLTFPGVIAHEFAHAWACRRLGIRVERVCYLRIGNPLGYVLHEQPPTAVQHIIVATAPFFVSSLLAALASLTASLITKTGLPPETRYAITTLVAWLSFSFALHSFPSSGDADALWQDVTSPDIGFFAKILLVPIVGLIRLAQLGTRYWLDILYALAILALAPALLLITT